MSNKCVSAVTNFDEDGRHLLTFVFQTCPTEVELNNEIERRFGKNKSFTIYEWFGNVVILKGEYNEGSTST